MANPTTQVFDFVFEGSSGNIDHIDVTASTVLTPVINGGGAVGYSTETITGDIHVGGKDVAIAGQFGIGGNLTQNNFAIFDNTIFATPSDGVDYNGATGSTAGIDNPGLEFKIAGIGGSDFNLYTSNGQFFLFDSSKPTVQYSLTLLCFCPGTMISTEHGDVAVEALAAGDMVVTNAGKTAPIRWIGRRAIAPRFMDPLKVMPIRIKAGALAEGMPARDLLLSPDHAVLVEGVLAHAGALVNGSSIIRETVMPESFTYYHIELADHALVLAEGTPAETFVDNVDRMAFDNWAEYQALVQNEAPIVEMDLPRAKAHRQVPASIRAMLSTRAAPLAAQDLALSA